MSNSSSSYTATSYVPIVFDWCEFDKILEEVVEEVVEEVDLEEVDLTSWRNKQIKKMYMRERDANMMMRCCL